MRLTIVCIGRMRHGPEKSLLGEYLKRLPWKLFIKEIDEKDYGNPALQIRREAAMLLEAAEGYERCIALDERGKELTSREFTGKLQLWRQEGVGSAAFIIGGSHGLDDTVRQRADMLLSLGRMTWPHLLARVLLAEQLYRAHTILSGHPYHRD